MSLAPLDPYTNGNATRSIIHTRTAADFDMRYRCDAYRVQSDIRLAAERGRRIIWERGISQSERRSNRPRLGYP